MPFPWTKNRVTRFSQIVADLQFQSPKRGRSLVVQTGFPTSLIDLFVKNRNRFKKPRFNKPLPTELPDSPPPPPPPSPVTTPELLIPYVSPPESPMPSTLTEEITDEAPVTDFVSERRFVPSTKLVIVKLLTVMILLAIVKGFTVAFTVSALSLLFLEYAVKRVVSFIKPCSEAIVAMESHFHNFLFQLKTKTKEKSETATVNGGGGEIELNLNLNSSTIDEEIDVVESKIELEPLESEYKIKSRSGRFKAKMVKKLISKKFRCSKKEKKIIEEEEKEKESKENEGDMISEISSEEIKNEIECVSERDYKVDFGTTCSKESNSKAIGDSGYRILVIIVLVGLILGRLPALLLTIVWCFLLKIVKALWKSQSHIKSSVPNS